MRPLLPWITAGLVACGVPVWGQTPRGTNRIALTNLNRVKAVAADGAGGGKQIKAPPRRTQASSCCSS